MTPSESLPVTQSPEDNGADYNLRAPARPHRRGASRTSTSNRMMRYVYFAAAGTWGFLIGVTGLLASLASGGNAVRPEGRALLVLVPALAVAIAGGGIIAGAYQETKHRRR